MSEISSPPTTPGRSALSKRIVVNFVLLSAVLVLIALAVFTSGPRQEPPLRLTSLPPEAVTSIEFESRDGEAVRLERADRTFRMTTPFAVDADGVRVATLLGLTQTVSQARLAAGAVDLAQLGLVNPAFRVRLNDLELEFGGTDALNGYRYVRVGDEVHLIVDRFSHHLQAGVPAWVALRLLPEEAAMTSVELPNLVLRRTAGRGWVAEAGGDGKVPREVDAEALAQRWRDVAATGVARAVAGEILSHAVIHLVAPARTLEFELRAVGPEYLAARRDIDIAYRLSAQDAQGLFNRAAAEAPR